MSPEVVQPTFPTLENPPYPRLTYGLPFHEACVKHVRETFKAKRPYIIASATLSKKTPFLTQLQDAFGSGISGTWIGIPQHTPVNSLIPIIQDMRGKQGDCLITLGGGSLSDGAKLISLALANDVNSVEDIMALPRIGDDGKHPESYGNTKPPSVPVVCIPISLSGGEYSCFAGVTDPATNFKYQFVHEKLYPSLVILDPNLTRSTPMRTWLSTGVRSVDHCIEGFLSTNSTEEGDGAATKALLLLINGLLWTKCNPDDIDSRLKCQLGSNLSMSLLHLKIMKGASHGIGHQLGPLGVSHGETSCILLPAVCKYNAPVNADKQKVLQFLLTQQEPVQGVLKKAGVKEGESDLGDVLRAIFDALDVPRNLKDVGVGAEQLDDLANGCLKECFVLTNPRPIKSKEDVLMVLHQVIV